MIFYATFTFISAFSINSDVLLALRFLTGIWVGAEYSALQTPPAASSVGVLSGGVTVAALMDRFSRAVMVISTYLLAAGGIGVLAVAALAGGRMGGLFALIFVSAAISGSLGLAAAFAVFARLWPQGQTNMGRACRVFLL